MINRITDFSAEARHSSASANNRGVILGQRSVQQMIEPVEQMIAKYPGLTLAVAFAVGVTVAWWIKRR